MSELAQAIGISKTAAYELVRTDGFPAMRIGQRILIPADALDRWLLEQAEKGAN